MTRKYPAGTAGGRGGQFAPDPGCNPPTASSTPPPATFPASAASPVSVDDAYRRFLHLNETSVEVDDSDRHDYLFSYREHGYDPRWNYTIRYDQLDHPLMLLARSRADFLASLDETGFEKAHVYPCDLGGASVGVYCSGTYCEPVILIDVDAHVDPDVVSPEDEIRRTVDHEVPHACQEQDWDGDPDHPWADEDHAEHHRFPLGFA